MLAATAVPFGASTSQGVTQGGSAVLAATAVTSSGTEFAVGKLPSGNNEPNVLQILQGIEKRLSDIEGKFSCELAVIEERLSIMEDGYVNNNELSPVHARLDSAEQRMSGLDNVEYLSSAVSGLEQSVETLKVGCEAIRVIATGVSSECTEVMKSQVVQERKLEQLKEEICFLQGTSEPRGSEGRFGGQARADVNVSLPYCGGFTYNGQPRVSGVSQLPTSTMTSVVMSRLMGHSHHATTVMSAGVSMPLNGTSQHPYVNGNRTGDMPGAQAQGRGTRENLIGQNSGRVSRASNPDQVPPPTGPAHSEGQAQACLLYTSPSPRD